MNLKLAGTLGFILAGGVVAAFTLGPREAVPVGDQVVTGSSVAAVAGTGSADNSATSTPVTTLRPDSASEALYVGTVSPRSADPKHPHEPAGFTAFAENDFSRLPRTSQLTPGGLSGIWRANGVGGGRESNDSDDDGDQSVQRGAGGRLQIAEDPSAPVSPPGVLRMMFPRGWKAGNGPVNWGGWDKDGPAAQKQKLYMSLSLRIAGSDYENQAVGTKMGFIASGPGPEVKGHSGNQSLFFLKGYGKQGTFSTFKVEFHQFFNAQINPPFKTNFHPQNQDRRALMTTGVWHQWEVVMSLNDVGRDNGSLDWWIDGNQVMHYDGLVFRVPRAERGFWNFKFNPTWGGTGGVKTRDDFIEIDHIYFSGVPLGNE